MTNRLDGLSETTKWHLMVEAAKLGAKAQGYELERVPGRTLKHLDNHQGRKGAAGGDPHDA